MSFAEHARQETARLALETGDRVTDGRSGKLETSDRLATAIAAAFRRRGPVGLQEYVLNDGSRATRLAGAHGSYCVTMRPVWSVLAESSRSGSATDARRLMRISCPSNGLPTDVSAHPSEVDSSPKPALHLAQEHKQGSRGAD